MMPGGAYIWEDYVSLNVSFTDIFGATNSIIVIAVLRQLQDQQTPLYIATLVDGLQHLASIDDIWRQPWVTVLSL